jgi:hypothetical protein
MNADGKGVREVDHVMDVICAEGSVCAAERSRVEVTGMLGASRAVSVSWPAVTWSRPRELPWSWPPRVIAW